MRPSIHIQAVTKASHRKRFLRAPLSFFAQDPCYIQPLEAETGKWLRGKGAWFEHAELQGWLAWRGDQLVGRISAQVDNRHPQRNIGQFGFLDAVDDQQVFNALLETATAWLQERGAERIQGPFDPGINNQCGLLVEGFTTPPALLMGHALPYYQQRYLDYGLQPVQTLLAYDLNVRFQAKPFMYKLVRRYRPKLVIREPDWSRRDAEMEIMRAVFNDAWQDNWGFVPFTQAEFAEMGREIKPLIHPGWVHIVELDGEAVGFIVLLPDVNDLVADFNGRLLPFNLFKLLYRLRMRPIRKARVPLMGVCKRFHGSPMAAVIAFLLIEQLQIHSVPQGLQQVELSWILEDNKGMRNIIEDMTGTVYKRYQLFEKTCA
jgi:hypothetical protein